MFFITDLKILEKVVVLKDLHKVSDRIKISVVKKVLGLFGLVADVKIEEG